MNEQTFMASLTAPFEQQPPTNAPVIVLQQLSLHELQGRARRLISILQQQDECAHDNGDWRVGEDTSVINLPGGATVTVYHASGALQYASGIPTLTAPFKRGIEQDALIRLVNAAALKLRLSEWAGPGNELVFERLFQSKATGADRKGAIAETTLFRALGAYRQVVGGLPVLGAASAALRLTGDGQVDSLWVKTRPATGEVLDRPAIISADLAGRELVMRLLSVLGTTELPRDRIESASMQLGYLDLGKRKPQRVLAPMYVAQVVIRHRSGRQGYVLAVPATDRIWLEAPLFGTQAVPTVSRAHVCEHERSDLIR